MRLAWLLVMTTEDCRTESVCQLLGTCKDHVVLCGPGVTGDKSGFSEGLERWWWMRRSRGSSAWSSAFGCDFADNGKLTERWLRD